MLSKVTRKTAPVAVRQFGVWSELTAAPADPILGLNALFAADSAPNKVLLGAGAYRDDNGKPYVLPCVREAERLLLEKKVDHEYAPIEGLGSYIKNCGKLAYGQDSQLLKDDRIAAAQSISGTGSIRAGFDFLREWYPNKQAKVYIPDPTWPIHKTVQPRVGFGDAQTYRYYNRKTNKLDYDGLREDLDKAANESLVLLHVCAHNPTGVDPTPEQWQGIKDVVTRKGHFVIFDSAYQGFASGDLEKDAYALRLFAKDYPKIMLFQSFAKNFGLYGERAGCISFICDSKKEKDVAMSRLKIVARNLYSNPPLFGARLVDTILNDAKLTKDWHGELVLMSTRMQQMRQGLVAGLKKLGNPHDWSHVTDQIGMFAYTGLSTELVNKIREEHHVYMTADGRISIAGLNTGNLDHVANSFHAVTKDLKSW